MRGARGSVCFVLRVPFGYARRLSHSLHQAIAPDPGQFNGSADFTPQGSHSTLSSFSGLDHPNANQSGRLKPMFRILASWSKDGLSRFVSLNVAALLLAACDERSASDKVEVHQQRKDQNLPRFRLLSETEPAKFKAADLRVKPRPVWIRSGSKKGKLSQSAKPVVDAEKTKLLAQSIAADASDKDGVVKLQREGVVIYPGTTMPTRVDFDVTGKFGRVILHAWLVRLPEEALSDRRFGTAGVSVLVDGRSCGFAPVDRYTNQSIALDLTHASELSVVVDNYNNLNLWDWCMVGLE
jgi:hypothetical protein